MALLIQASNVSEGCGGRAGCRNHRDLEVLEGTDGLNGMHQYRPAALWWQPAAAATGWIIVSA